MPPPSVHAWKQRSMCGWAPAAFCSAASASAPSTSAARATPFERAPTPAHVRAHSKHVTRGARAEQLDTVRFAGAAARAVSRRGRRR